LEIYELGFSIIQYFEDEDLPEMPSILAQIDHETEWKSHNEKELYLILFEISC